MGDSSVVTPCLLALPYIWSHVGSTVNSKYLVRYYFYVLLLCSIAMLARRSGK